MKGAHFYIDRDGKTEGPFDLDSLRAMAGNGAIGNETIVAMDGWERWVPLSDVLASRPEHDKSSEAHVPFLLENSDFVAFIKQKTDAILRGKLDEPTAVLYLDQFLETIEYVPAVEDIDIIHDLSSYETQELIVRTVVESAQGYGQYVSGLDSDVQSAYPAWRVITGRTAVVPRDWVERWTTSCQAAGDDRALALYRTHGAMAALKASAVWDRLCDHGLWPDALGNPWPPFYLNSGKVTEDVGFIEAEKWGLVVYGQKRSSSTRKDGPYITDILMRIQEAMPHLPHNACD